RLVVLGRFLGRLLRVVVLRVVVLGRLLGRIVGVRLVAVVLIVGARPVAAAGPIALLRRRGEAGFRSAGADRRRGAAAVARARLLRRRLFWRRGRRFRRR